MAQVILPASFVKPVAEEAVALLSGLFFGNGSAAPQVTTHARELLAAANAAIECGMANPMVTVTGEEWFAVTKHWVLQQAKDAKANPKAKSASADITASAE